MIFVTIEDVDAILGDTWTTQDKKALAVFDANTWLSKKSFCNGLKPIADGLKQAGAYLARLSVNSGLYVTKEAVVTEKSVKADTVQVTKKFATGQESAVSADMQRVLDLISPYECKGFGFNTRVCK